MPPPRALCSSIPSTWAPEWTRRSCSRLAAGACARSNPSHPSPSIAASIARSRPAFSGCGPVSCSYEDGWYTQSAIGRLPYPPLVGSAESQIECEVAVVGGGAAGLYVALRAAEGGATVALVSRKPLAESASFWAQGGLAAALAPDDSPARHAEDTLAAGRGLCRTAAVEALVEAAPGAVEQLQARGVRFDAERDGELALGLEGGHSARRIVHAGGSETGRAITSRLAELVAAHDRIAVLEGA